MKPPHMQLTSCSAYLPKYKKRRHYGVLAQCSWCRQIFVGGIAEWQLAEIQNQSHGHHCGFDYTADQENARCRCGKTKKNPLYEGSK